MTTATLPLPVSQINLDDEYPYCNKCEQDRELVESCKHCGDKVCACTMIHTEFDDYVCPSCWDGERTYAAWTLHYFGDC